MSVLFRAGFQKCLTRWPSQYTSFSDFFLCCLKGPLIFCRRFSPWARFSAECGLAFKRFFECIFFVSYFFLSQELRVEVNRCDELCEDDCGACGACGDDCESCGAHGADCRHCVKDCVDREKRAEHLQKSTQKLSDAESMDGSDSDATQPLDETTDSD